MLEHHSTDKEQVDMLKKWWKGYGRTIAVAIIIGVAVGYGWRYYQRYETNQLSTAAMLYEHVLVVPAADQKVGLQTLMKKYDHTVYGSLAGLLKAGNQVRAKQYQVAVKTFRWVIQQDHQASIVQIARLRLARVLLQLKQSKEALTVLATVSDSAYLPLIESIRGDAYKLEGDRAKAIKQYQLANLAAKKTQLNDPFLAEK